MGGHFSDELLLNFQPMMPNIEKKERQQAAAIALMDWSKWLVTLQPAAILAISGVVKFGSELTLGCSGRTLLILSLASVVVSLLEATFALGGLPTVIERLPSTAADERGIYDMSVYGLFRVWQIVLVEHLFFVLGIAFFSTFLCISIARHK
jgi:hypothetical protein